MALCGTEAPKARDERLSRPRIANSGEQRAALVPGTLAGTGALEDGSVALTGCVMIRTLSAGDGVRST
jgi:hypothetical protein